MLINNMLCPGKHPKQWNKDRKMQGKTNDRKLIARLYTKYHFVFRKMSVGHLYR